jgi:hypothetical protein
MDGADIGETASRGDDRERRAGLATQEEQSRMRLAGVGASRLVVIELVEDLPAATCILDQSVQRGDGLGNIDLGMVR